MFRARRRHEHGSHRDRGAVPVAPEQASAGSTARYLLADLREELAKPKPDLTLAGTYLGIASAMPVTPALVADIGNSLCAPVSEHAAQTIARVAEAQQRKLTRGR